MKIRMLLYLLAAIAAASPAAAEPCSTVASRNTIAETLRRAAEDRPVNVTFQTRAEGVKISENLKSKYSDAMTIILQNEFKQLAVKDDRFEVMHVARDQPGTSHRALRCDQGVLGQRDAEVLRRLK